MSFRKGSDHSQVLKFSVFLMSASGMWLIASTSFAAVIVSYDFDGNALDSSGLGNNGTILGSPTFVPSDLSDAIFFNNPVGQQAATQYVRLPNSASILGLNNSSFTYALRYQSTDTSMGNGRIFGNTSTATPGILHSSGSGVTNSESFISGTAGIINFAADFAADPLAFTADGLWHWTVTVVDRDTSTFRYYVDDHLIVDKSFGPLGLVGFSNLLIGANSFGGANTFFGARQTSVDEFRLYSHALTPMEVDQLVNASAAVPEPSAILMLGFGVLGVGGYGWRRRNKKGSS